MKKDILLVSATGFEIQPFLNSLRATANRTQPDVLITGVGLTATTYALTRHLAIKRPGLIIQAGLAGCFDNNAELGSVFKISRDLIADEIAIESGTIRTITDLGFRKPNTAPYKNGWLVNSSPAFNLLKAPKALGISVNQVSTNKKQIELFREKYSPLLESMEGAALHYVCLLEQIPFLQIRAASNYVGERNKSKWKLKESIFNLNQTLIKLFDKL